MLKTINISWITQCIMGLLIIANLTIAVMGNNLYSNVVEKAAIETTAETEEKEEKPAQFLINYQAIMPVSQLPVFVPFSFSFELVLVEEREEKELEEIPVFINAYFFTLFRQIISPNAP